MARKSEDYYARYRKGKHDAMTKIFKDIEEIIKDCSSKGNLEVWILRNYMRDYKVLHHAEKDGGA